MMEGKTHSRIYELACGQERERTRELIETVRSNTFGDPLFVNLFAPRGFGKTFLLEQVREEYARVLPVSLVCVNDFCAEDGKMIILQDLLIHIINDLAMGLPRRIDLPPDYESWTDEEQLARLLLDIVSDANKYEKVPLFLIDDYDLIPERQDRWFRQSVLGPLAQTRRIVVILTSKSELRFTEIEIRMRLENRELLGLDAETVSSALPDYEETAEQIYRVTGGVPFLVEALAKHLEEAQVTTLADFRAQAKHLIVEYHRASVRAYVEDKVLAGLPSEVGKAVPVLALLRRFNPRMLQALLPRLLPEFYQGYRTAGYLDLIDCLRPWVRWRRQGGYTIHPALRMVLRGYILTTDQKLYERANRQAVGLYREWLKREYRPHYVIELLYHVLALQVAREPSAFLFPHNAASRSRVSKELVKYLTEGEGCYLQAAELEALRESLERDADLRGYISEDAKQVIRDMIRSRYNNDVRGLSVSPSLV